MLSALAPSEPGCHRRKSTCCCRASLSPGMPPHWTTSFTTWWMRRSAVSRTWLRCATAVRQHGAAVPLMGCHHPGRWSQFRQSVEPGDENSDHPDQNCYSTHLYYRHRWSELRAQARTSMARSLCPDPGDHAAGGRAPALVAVATGLVGRWGDTTLKQKSETMTCFQPTGVIVPASSLQRQGCPSDRRGVAHALK